MWRPILFLLLAILPGAYALVTSRKLFGKVEDPFLPDLVRAHYQAVGIVFGLSVGVGAALLGVHVAEMTLVAFVSALVGGFPLRKKIYGETWSLPACLSHSLRFWFGVLGSVVLLACIPSAMAYAPPGAPRLALGAAFGAMTVVWALTGPVLLLRFVRARPVESPELLSSFARVLDKARCAAPNVLEAEAPGGHWVNAFALPSLRGSAVLMTRGLLDALTPEETTGIFAHEVAHLEHHTRRKLAVALVKTVLLVSLPLILWGGPMARLDPEIDRWAWLWPLGVFLGLRARIVGHRAHEAESDRRAVELTGDPEALVSALTKIHTLLRLSRRWSDEQERRSSHPSLARRIQVIRAAGAGPSALPPEDARGIDRLFRADDGSGNAVLFDESKLHSLRGVPSDDEDVLKRAAERRSIPYAELRELHLAGTEHARRLVFTDSRRRTTRMPVAADDVAELDAVLDRVDSRLGYAPASRGRPTGAIGTLLIALLAFVPLLSFSLLALAVLALVEQAEATLLALGVAGLTVSLWRSLRPDAIAATLPSWYLVALVALSLALVVDAVGRGRRNVRPKRRTLLVAVLAPVALALTSLLLQGVPALVASLPAMHLHLWARKSPTVASCLLAAAAALWTGKRSKFRLGSAALAAGALSFVYVGSLPFRERMTGDAFRSVSAPIPVRDVSLRRVFRVGIPGRLTGLRLSPEGTRFSAATRYPGESSDNVELVIAGQDGNDVVRIRALAVDFLDEDRVAILTRDAASMVLEIAPAPDPSSRTRVRELPLLDAPRFYTSAATGAWRVQGESWDEDDEEGETVVFQGTFGSDQIDELRFPSSTFVQINRGDWALGESYGGFEGGEWGGSYPLLYLLLTRGQGTPSTELRLARSFEPSRSVGTSALSLGCVSDPFGDDRFFCTASDGERTSIWSLDPESTSWKPLGAVEGGFHGVASAVAPGGRFVLHRWGAPPILIDLDRNAVLEPWRGEGETTADSWGDVAWSGSGTVLASSTCTGRCDETTVTLYTLDP